MHPHKAEIIFDLKNGQRMSVRYAKLKHAQTDYDHIIDVMLNGPPGSVVRIEGDFKAALRAEAIETASLVDTVKFEKLRGAQ